VKRFSPQRALSVKGTSCGYPRLPASAVHHLLASRAASITLWVPSIFHPPPVPCPASLQEVDVGQVHNSTHSLSSF